MIGIWLLIVVLVFVVLFFHGFHTVIKNYFSTKSDDECNYDRDHYDNNWPMWTTITTTTKTYPKKSLKKRYPSSKRH